MGVLLTPPSHSEAPLLQVRDLSVSAGFPGCPPLPVLAGLDFELRRGEITGLLGPSGCGKSTAAMAVMGLLPPAMQVVGGAILFRGTDLLARSEAEMESLRGAEIAVIFQEAGLALNPVMAAGAQIMEVLRAHRDWDRSRLRAEAESLLRKVELSDLDRIFHSYPHQLSGGQCQRVVLAQALACGPALVIADEPTASLDTTTQAEVLGLLEQLRKDRSMTMLFISHHPAVLARIADRVLVMKEGRIVESGETPAVLRAPRHPFTQALLAAVPQRPGYDA